MPDYKSLYFKLFAVVAMPWRSWNSITAALPPRSSSLPSNRRRRTIWQTKIRPYKKNAFPLRGRLWGTAISSDRVL